MKKKWKLILNLEVFLCAFLVCAFLVVLIIKIAVGALAGAQTILTDMEESNLRFEEEKRGELNLDNLEEDIGEINEVISKTKSFFDKKENLTVILNSFSQILPPGCRLNSFSFQEKSSKVSILGSCPNRERLVELKENIEEKEDIKNLSFPSSNWLNPDKFSLTFEIND